MNYDLVVRTSLQRAFMSASAKGPMHFTGPGPVCILTLRLGTHAVSWEWVLTQHSCTALGFCTWPFSSSGPKQKVGSFVTLLGSGHGVASFPCVYGQILYDFFLFVGSLVPAPMCTGPTTNTEGLATRSSHVSQVQFSPGVTWLWLLLTALTLSSIFIFSTGTLDVCVQLWYSLSKISVFKVGKKISVSTQAY